MKTMVEQIDILETLTPMSFNSFRDRLEAASGFQSTQFRELEFLLGLQAPGHAALPETGNPRIPAPGSAVARAFGRRLLL